jgi:transcriptional regulator with XRE-family HTH domain
MPEVFERKKTKMPTQLGIALRALRVRANMSQVLLAKRSGIVQKRISQIETGECVPSLATVNETSAKLARAMGIPTQQIRELMYEECNRQWALLVEHYRRQAA